MSAPDDSVAGKQQRWVAALRTHDRAGVRGAVQRLTDEAILAMVFGYWLEQGIVGECPEPSERKVAAFITWAIGP